MNRFAIVLALATLGATAGQIAPADAAQWVYEYRINHPQYGDVGIYTNTVEQMGERIDVRTQVNIQVKVLGLVVYRQQAERREFWQNGRLTSFRGRTTINGKMTEV